MPPNRTDPTVVATRRGNVGHILLNRPTALNALDHAMVLHLLEALERFESDSRVQTIVLEGAGDRGLCAGGDVRTIHHDAVHGTGEAARFWADEYRLILTIANLGKPYVAIMDGIVMGGGVGVSGHGSHRIVTERTALAMPEVRIGLMPDVGATHLLTRVPGNGGVHLALTAATIDGSDALYLNLADAYLESVELPDLLSALETEPVTAALARFSRPAPPSGLASTMTELDGCYRAESPGQVVANLMAVGSDSALAAAKAILRHSPTALSVTLHALRAARELPGLAACLDMEYRVMTTRVRHQDVQEGIRAQVIDKDRAPRWQPKDLGAVSGRDVLSHFESLGERQLGFSV